jgi:hypothetical protein
MPRTEEERAGGYLLVRYNGESWELPTLKRERERAWKRLLPDRLGPLFKRLVDEWKPGDDVNEVFGSANEQYVDAMVELLVAYDESRVIGREGFDSLDSDQIKDLFGRVYEITNPFDQDLQKATFQIGMAAIGAALEAARSAGANSTNGRSPAGDSSPESSTAASIPSRSSSSGDGRRSASRPKPVNA